MKRNEKLYPKNRRCPVCNTILNRYNKGPNCLRHQSGVNPTFSQPSTHPTTRSTRAGSPTMRGLSQAEDWGF